MKGCNGVELKIGDKIKVYGITDTSVRTIVKAPHEFVWYQIDGQFPYSVREEIVEKIENVVVDQRGIEIKVGSAIVFPTRSGFFTVKSLDQRSKDRDFVTVESNISNMYGFWADTVLVLA